MKYILLTLLLFVSCFHVKSQSPDWVNRATRMSKYSDKIYFKGFVSQYVKKKDDLNAIQQKMILNSKIALSEGIRINIESSITNQMVNQNAVSTEDFKKISKSYSRIEVAGIKTEFSLSKNKKEAYAFTWIKKSKVRNYYISLIKTNLLLIQEKLDRADLFIKNKNGVKAIPLLQAALVLLRKVEESQAILIICGENSIDIIRHQNAVDLGMEISNKMESVISSHDFDMNGLAYHISNQLNLKREGIDKVRVENVFYQDTDMSSPFSVRLNALMVSNISMQEVSIIDLSTKANELTYILEGSYWEHKDELQVIVNLYKNDAFEKLLINSVEGWIKIDELENDNISFIPKNVQEAISKNDIFVQNAIINGGATLEIWTNKGAKGPVYKEGDLLKIYVNSSQSGYFRLLNFWADGTQLLLEDNFFIAPDQTNQTIELPMEWRTTCPCGVEYLHALVQTEPFETLNTVKEGGFFFIQNEFKETIKKSRSFTNRLSIKGNYIAEMKLILTTLE